MNRVAAIAVMFSLLGCGPHDESFIEAAKITVKKELSNPDSAKFSEVFVVRNATQLKTGDEYVVTCGWVNSKTPMGKFGGATRFVVFHTLKDGEIVTERADIANILEDRAIQSRRNPSKLTPFEHEYWNSACVDAKHPAL